MSASNPAERPGIPPQPPVFDENEETESFYVILDLSSDDYAAYGKYRDGRKFRPRLGSYSSTSSNPTSDNENPAQSDSDKPTDTEDEEGDEDGEDGNDSIDSASVVSDPPDKPRELSLQILDLDTPSPLVTYEGKIYACTYKLSNGTEMIFSPPSPQNLDEEESASGRKIRVNQEAKLFATTVHRLEGWPGKLKPRGRDRQEVSTKARMFAERLDAVLEHRLKEAARVGEDVEGVTMKKFSETQQAWKG
ncbi:hypothetical protein TWF481_007016 [Arthrobotrys musiformis]|uniref:Transcription factor TFIIIC triple barrel domain-containing protein n=1 Tax=Arthrobotrys musiformis TaxID=47236 RepID=A0AAV9WCJ0_9PEZI